MPANHHPRVSLGKSLADRGSLVSRAIVHDDHLSDDGLAASYAAWPRFADRLVNDETPGAFEAADPDEKAFAARFRLVHEWRKFLFDDPGLPTQLLPDDWPGVRAAEVFTSEAARLKPAADRFVGRCLGTV